MPKPLFLLVFSVSFLLAQEALEQKKATVQGSVLNALTNEPLRKAQVTLSPGVASVGGGGRIVLMAGSMGRADKPGLSATTDAEGKFTFTGVEPGSYTLLARRTGFLDVQFGTGGRAAPLQRLTVSSGQELKDVVLKLTPQSVLAGRVVDEDGDPVQNAAVAVLAPRYMRGRREMIPQGGAQTNDRGEFRVANLAPGRYVLSAVPGMPASDSLTSDTGHVTVYYPGVIDISQAARIELGAGVELAGYDLRLQRTKVFRIRGKLVDAQTGTAPANAMVWLSPRDGFAMVFHQMSETTGKEGSFEIRGVVPGSYYVVASSQSGNIRPMQRQPVEVVDQNLEGLLLTLQPPQTLAGVLVADSGQKLEWEKVHVALHPAEAFLPGNSASTNADGTFSLSGVAPGKYTVNVWGLPENAYVDSVQAGEQRGAGPVVDFSAAVPSNLKILVGTQGGQISGRVKSKEEQPGPGSTVVLIPDDRKQSSLIKVTISDQAGGFQLRGIAPGNYLLFAWEKIEPGAWEDPDILKPVENEGQPVKVDRAGTVTAQVPLIPASQ